MSKRYVLVEYDDHADPDGEDELVLYVLDHHSGVEHPHRTADVTDLLDDRSLLGSESLRRFTRRLS